MRYRFTFLMLIAFCFWTVSSSSASASDAPPSKKPLKIIRVTPNGVDVPAGRQIVIQFNRPVVPVGRMARTPEEIPIDITPASNCQWRWLDTSALACQLGEKDALALATKYRVTIRPGIKAEDGETLSKTASHEFVAERPKVKYTNFRTWKSPGMPVVRVTFNQAVFKDTVQAHMFMTQSGKRYPLHVAPNPKDRAKPHMVAGREARRMWRVAPMEEMPLDADVRLEIEPGLASPFGSQRGVTQRAVVAFNTFPEFKFIGVRGLTNKDEEITVKADAEPSEVLRFSPLNRVFLVFSSPVILEEVKTKLSFTPDLAGGRTDFDPWANRRGFTKLRRTHKRGSVYVVGLPVFLKAWQPYRVQSISPNLQDEFGRKLTDAIDMTFFTDHRRPNFELIHKTAILEKNVATKAPLVITNIDKVRLDYTKLTAKARSGGQSKSFTHPDVEDVAFAVPLGVRDIMDGSSGAVYGKITTTPSVDKGDWGRKFFAQITPYQMHVKIGHFNTLVWVTDLATGAPVANADVTIYKDVIAQLKGTKIIQAVTDRMGIAMLPGTASLDPELKTFRWGNDDSERLFVRIVKGDDMALMPLEYRFLVDAYRVSNYAVYSSPKKKYGHMHAWGTTAQGVYRAGDTIQYKLYVRNQDNNTFIKPPMEGYKLEVIDPKGKVAHEVKTLALSEFGANDGEFSVPKNAVTGWYNFRLSADFTDVVWQPIRVLVSDFTPSPFRVQNEINGDLFEQGEHVQISTHAKLHSGGPYAEARVRVTARLKERYFSPKHRIAKGFRFDTTNKKSRGTHSIFQEEMVLDQEGKSLSDFALPDKGVLYGRLIVESAVQDDRGKYVATSSSAEYVGRDRFVGLKHTQWVYQEDKPAQVACLVVDAKGTPAADTDIEIKIERRVTKASRVKGAGNAYLTQYTDVWVPVTAQKLRSDLEPVTSQFTPQDPGSYRISATINDTQKRPHTTQLWMWVTGKGHVVWQQPDDNSLEIVPEQEAYKIGDTARYLVKNPFPGATALITIERYGVIKHWTQVLEGSTPIIEFEIEPDYLPGFYLSIVVTSPRVSQTLTDGAVDLGKPAMRVGYAAVPVKDPYKEITVQVSPEKQVYKPRDTVRLNIKATARNADVDEPIELAVAVLDEAVFDLLQAGRDYYNPYKGFYYLDGLDLRNYNLLKRLVGLQRFEKKGASAGGGGGGDISVRSVFKFVSYWNPSLATNKDGEATVAFEIPDNLTGWRVFAMAVTPTDEMGLGDDGFKVNRPTEIRPVMPNQVTAGDRFEAGFSVMNRTDSPRQLRVAVTVSGPFDPSKSRAEYTQTVALAPYQKQKISLPVHTKGAGQLVFKATAGDSRDGDGLQHSVTVQKRRALETAAAYGTTVGDAVSQNVLFPEKIHTDVGELSVVLAPTVIGNLAGAFQYMRDYPYLCWEQILTKGVMAAHYNTLKAYLPVSLVWKDSAALAQKTLDRAADFQAPNGGMTYFTPSNPYVSPYLSAYTALAFNWLQKSGLTVAENVTQKLHEYLNRLLRKDVFPGFYSKGMSATVRAVALAGLAAHRQVSVEDLARYQPHVAHMSLFGKALFLQAALQTEGADAIAEDVAKQIFAHASQTGGKLLFNETLDDGYKRILATPLRANAAILSAMIALLEKDYGAELVGDIPFKMVRAITQARGNRDHWENTQENMFCLNALVDYRRIYERGQPQFTVRALVDENLLGTTEFKSLTDDAVTFSRPISATDPGQKARVAIQRQGDGRLYYATRLRFAPLEAYADRSNAGMEIRREYSVERDGHWELLESPMQVRRGELVRVDLYLSLPTARHFVVVDDPVPGGLEPVNRDLATASAVDAEKGDFTAAGGSWWFNFSDWIAYNASRWSFYHRELRHDAARFYSEYLPAGNYHLSYTAQVIAVGAFAAMPAHAEEMYDPDVFGKGIPAVLQVTDGS